MQFKKFTELYIFSKTLRIISGLCFVFLWQAAVACGTNTEQPVFPLILSFANGVGSPAIISVDAVETETPEFDLIIEFDLKYYLTNGENGFQGYNLYIRTSRTSSEAALTGTGSGPYLPGGTIPSFAHVGEIPSTSNLKLQRITHYIPPPGEKGFEICEKYFFRLSAVFRSGVESRPSPEAEACATTDISLCPIGSVCNP